MFNRNLKDRFHRRDAPYLFVEDKATVLQDQPAQNYVAQLNQVFGSRDGPRRARSGGCGASFPRGIRRKSRRTTSPFAIQCANTRINAAETQSLNPNHRYQANAA